MIMEDHPQRGSHIRPNATDDLTGNFRLEIGEMFYSVVIKVVTLSQFGVYGTPVVEFLP